MKCIVPYCKKQAEHYGKLGGIELNYCKFHSVLFDILRKQKKAARNTIIRDRQKKRSKDTGGSRLKWESTNQLV